MLQSPLLKKNPDLFVFLPIFYTVWSDAVLTPTEISAFKNLEGRRKGRDSFLTGVIGA